MDDSLKVVGKRLPGVDAFAKVTGRAEYCTNIHLPQMLVGKVLRSPHAHARVVKVDGSKAEKLPGVRAVVTHKDVPRKVFTYNVMTYQLPQGEIQDMFLFDYKVRYIGDPVAAVAAVNEEVANEALDLIEVEYEALPAMFDVQDALKQGAPKIHDFAEKKPSSACNAGVLLWRRGPGDEGSGRNSRGHLFHLEADSGRPGSRVQCG